jgi:hypothetical protein
MGDAVQEPVAACVAHGEVEPAKEGTAVSYKGGIGRTTGDRSQGHGVWAACRGWWAGEVRSGVGRGRRQDPGDKMQMWLVRGRDP